MLTETTAIMPTARHVDVARMRVVDVCAEDIARALSMQVRCNGAVLTPWSEAQYAILVADILHVMNAAPAVQLCGLLRNASSAYIGTVCPHTLRAISPQAAAELVMLADRVAQTIEAWAGVGEISNDEERLIDAAIVKANAIERRLKRPIHPSGSDQVAIETTDWWSRGRTEWLDRLSALQQLLPGSGGRHAC